MWRKHEWVVSGITCQNPVVCSEQQSCLVGGLALLWSSTFSHKLDDCVSDVMILGCTRVYFIQMGLDFFHYALENVVVSPGVSALVE